MKVDLAPYVLKRGASERIVYASAAALLYYYIFVYSRAATNLGSPASWGRLVACGRLAIGLPAGAQSAGRRVANPPQDAILPHMRRAVSTFMSHTRYAGQRALLWAS
jgi:hypothetical protein